MENFLGYKQLSWNMLNIFIVTREKYANKVKAPEKKSSGKGFGTFRLCSEKLQAY